MYIGNQTAFFTSNPEEPFEYALSHSFTAFEWFSDKKHYDNGLSSGWGYSDVTTERAKELKEIAESEAIRFSVHASCNASPLTHEGMKDIFLAAATATDIGAKLVNIHLDATEGVYEFTKSLVPVILATKARGLQLAIENTPLHSPEEFNELFVELEKLDVESIDHVGMCLDIGHANCCDATRNDYIGFIDRLDSKVSINHCHVHENWGDSDSHLALFTASSADNDTGVRLFIDRLKGRNYSGSLIMEQWPDEHELLENIFIRLNGMLGIEIERKVVEVEKGILETTDNPIILSEENTENTGSNLGDIENDVFTSDESDIPKAPLQYNYDSESWVLDAIIDFSKSNKSWRRRLEAVKDLFFADKQLELSDLAAIAVYLRLLSTAEIPCVEDGGHYRPCHHAKAAMEIENAVSKVRSDSNAWILRRIYPYLPSHAEEFMRHEPLTRIRDIAHRNDIPKEIKLDIKHNLQNKLHRSAGPEDLITAQRILGIITADGGNYSGDFVNEFKIFYEELKEFFNAIGLEKRLVAIKNDFCDLAVCIDNFLNIKNSGEPLDKASAALTIRENFDSLLKTRGDILPTQLRLADIELEDFAFATISEAVNSYGNSDCIDVRGFNIIGVALKHIYLSEFMRDEVECLINEFVAWEDDVLQNGSRLPLLRLWGSIQRGLRLCSSYADIVNSVFTGAVVRFGCEFKIPPHAIEVYCEGDIRANIVFQLSRILGIVQRSIRPKLGFAPWSVINGGIARGEVVGAESLAEFDERNGQYIVLLRHAQGDEEIPASVCAVLLAHPIAHLSHLGVRARSGRVPFAAAEEMASFTSLSGMIGKEVALNFNQDGVSECEDIGADVSNDTSAEIFVPEVSLSEEFEVLNADMILSNTCGAKAGASAELYLASENFSEFDAPKVMAIPYGVMELCLEEDEELYDEYEACVNALDGVELSELDGKLEALVRIIQRISIPQGILLEVAEYFGSETSLAVRSSSSGEDLVGFAGAGLYDSVIGVELGDLDDAIKTVWASKWTRRAVLSRDKYGVEHSDVYMGVLIQEVVDAEYSFVLHTANPVTGSSDEIGIEMAVGFGETLASANQVGSPCRIKYIRSTGEVVIERCADLSYSLVSTGNIRGLAQKVVDYSKFDPFLEDNLFGIAGVLCKIGSELEKHFGTAQDIEGAFSKGKFFVVQSRAQAGIDRV